MSWSGLASNQMVTFTDAQTSGFTLNPGQSAVTSNECMTKLQALTKYNLSEGEMDIYSNNQLVPKGVWFNGGAITRFIVSRYLVQGTGLKGFYEIANAVDCVRIDEIFFVLPDPYVLFYKGCSNSTANTSGVTGRRYRIWLDSTSNPTRTLNIYSNLRGLIYQTTVPAGNTSSAVLDNFELLQDEIILVDAYFTYPLTLTNSCTAPILSITDINSTQLQLNWSGGTLIPSSGWRVQFTTNLSNWQTLLPLPAEGATSYIVNKPSLYGYYRIAGTPCSPQVIYSNLITYQEPPSIIYTQIFGWYSNPCSGQITIYQGNDNYYYSDTSGTLFNGTVYIPIGPNDVFSYDWSEQLIVNGVFEDNFIIQSGCTPS
jgi:hypothetical protein